MTSTKRSPRKRQSLRKGPVCSICKHEHRVLIESTRIAGASLDHIGAKYGVSRDSVFRHMRAHVSEDLKAEYLAGVPLKELAEKATAEGLSLLQYFSIVRATLLNQMQLAAAVNDRHATSALARTLTECLREIGRVSGEVLRSPAVQNITTTVNFINSPIFLDLQQMLVRRLAGHPEAMAAVVEGLRELETRAAPRATAAPMIEHQGGAHAAA